MIILDTDKSYLFTLNIVKTTIKLSEGLEKPKLVISDSTNYFYIFKHNLIKLP